jgi:hypothetical protein
MIDAKIVMIASPFSPALNELLDARPQLVTQPGPLLCHTQVMRSESFWQQLGNRGYGNAAQLAVATQYTYIAICELGSLGDKLTARSTRCHALPGAERIVEGEADYSDRLDVEVTGGIRQG